MSKKVLIEDVTTKLYNIASLQGDMSGSVIPDVCREAMMEISFLRDRVVLLEHQVDFMAAVNAQMREDLETYGG